MTRKFEITSATRGAAFTVRVVTRAQKTEIAGVQDDGMLKIRLTAAPTDGQSNAQLIQFLADRLGVETSQVEIIGGLNNRDKMIVVSGISTDVVEQRLKPDEGAAVAD
jgi:uncharacterized protein (TIGR00251 family)